MTNHPVVGEYSNTVQETIRSTASKISKTFGVDSYRVRRILERTRYEGRAPNFPEKIWGIEYNFNDNAYNEQLKSLHSYYFTPSLIAALECIRPEDALTLFETEDLDQLSKRDVVSRYLFGRTSLLHSLDDLERITASLIDHLKRNREHIIKTGLPRTSFHQSPVFDQLLSPLYFTKSPSSLHGEGYLNFRNRCNEFVRGYIREADNGNKYSVDDLSNRLISSFEISFGPPNDVVQYDKDGNFLYDYVWHTGFEGSTPYRCSYEQAPILRILTSEDADRIDADRSKLFDLKIKTLHKALKAVQKGSAYKLRKNCLQLLMKTLTVEEIEFYLRLDQTYIDAEILSYVSPVLGPRSVTGGLTDLFEVIGHYEKELTIGTYAKTREALGNKIKFEDVRYPPRYVSDLFSPYFKYVSHGKKGILDNAVEIFLSLQPKEYRFWSAYNNTVNKKLQEEFARKFLGEVGIDDRFYERFIADHRNFLENFMWWIQARGEPPDHPPYYEKEPPRTLDYIFRKEGEIWNIVFEGKSISLRDSKGLHYIAFLLAHPREKFHILRLVNEVDRVPRKKVDSTYAQMRDKEADPKDLKVLSSFEGEDKQQVLDYEAQRSIKERLIDIENELPKAEDENNLGLALKLREERENILVHLKKAMGLHGKPREFDSFIEKERKRVYGNIERVRQNIEEMNEELWRHLKTYIITGNYFSYDPLEDIKWIV